MTESDPTDASQAGATAPHDGPRLFETMGRKLDEMPPVQAAEEALRHAKEAVRQATEEWDRARLRYHDACNSAAATLHSAPERNAADWHSAALDFVRRYPAAGVVAAGAVGFLIGRLFHRK